MNPVQKTLSQIVLKIHKNLLNKIVLVGGANLYIQNVPGIFIEDIDDIDFATDYETVQKLSNIFRNNASKHCSNKSGDDILPFSYLKTRIEGYEVEFFDAITYGQSYYKSKIKLLNTKVLNPSGMRILQLTTELEVDKKAGKEEKVKAVEAFLKS